MTHPAYLPAEIRKYLLHDTEFAELLHGGKNTCREVPDPLVKPHVTVKNVRNQGIDPMLRRLIIQVTPWIPNPDLTKLTEDPDVTAWNLAWRAGELLSRSLLMIFMLGRQCGWMGRFGQRIRLGDLIELFIMRRFVSGRISVGTRSPKEDICLILQIHQRLMCG